MATTLINAVPNIVTTNISRATVEGVDSLVFSLHIPGLGPCTISAPYNATTQALTMGSTYTMTLTTP
jgi:hypothetical protein